MLLAPAGSCHPASPVPEPLTLVVDIFTAATALSKALHAILLLSLCCPSLGRASQLG